LENGVIKLNKNGALYALKPVLLATLLTGASIVAPVALASGSFGPVAGSGPQGKYNLGKVIYRKKVACKKCPSPAKHLAKAQAQELVQDLLSASGKSSYLKSKEKKAVVYYLKKRYKI